MNGYGNVLVADDEHTFREATCRLFQRNGFECVGVSDGDQTVEQLRHHRYDLLVADIRMPRNPDLRVVQAARETNSQMAVILVTGYPSMDTAIQSIQLPVVAYLTKPVDFDELLKHAAPAIEFSRARERLTAVRRRLSTCLADLEAAELKPFTRCDMVHDDLSLGTIRTLAAALSEIVELYTRLGGEGTPANLCQLLDCSMRASHRDEIVHAIEVLKKTKDTFKSKALAELRARLEAAVGVR